MASMNVVQIQPVKRLSLSCTKCGSIADAACDCGSPYIPALARAAEAVAATPERSNRAIADDIGVSEPTVRRARTASPDAVDERMGLDGKVRRMPRPPEPEPSIEDEVEPGNYRSAFLIRADQAVAFAKYSGRVSRDVVEAARAAARAWNDLVVKLEEEK